MTTTQMMAQDQIAANVQKWTLMLCDALKDNYREYAIRGYRYPYADNLAQLEYGRRKIEELKNGDCPIDYVIETGKKYHKVIFVDCGGSRSVHCFIDKKTGEVYKSASWKSPAKGVRYDLRLIADREYLLEKADWSGGYLYAK